MVLRDIEPPRFVGQQTETRQDAYCPDLSKGIAAQTGATYSAETCPTAQRHCQSTCPTGRSEWFTRERHQRTNSERLLTISLTLTKTVSLLTTATCGGEIARDGIGVGHSRLPTAIAHGTTCERH